MKNLDKNKISELENTIKSNENRISELENMMFYGKNKSSTEIPDSNEVDEQALELQETESEQFEEQGLIEHMKEQRKHQTFN